MRRAVADLDGEGEVTGGIVVMRHGENALNTIAAVKERIEALKAGLPEGVEVVETYDRSSLIQRAVDNLSDAAGGGARRRRAGVPAVPVPPALGLRRHRHPAARASWSPSW